MNALALEKRLDSARAPECAKEAVGSTGLRSQAPAAVTRPAPDSPQCDRVPPHVAHAIAAMRGEVRSVCIFLQILVVGVMVGSAVLHVNVLQLERSLWLPVVGLLAIFGGLCAYSDPSRPLIPTQVGHPFRRNAATDSEVNPATFSSLLGIGGRHPSE